MFRFTIRDLLWLTVVVGLAVGWMLTAQKAAILEARLQAVERDNAETLREVHQMSRTLLEDAGSRRHTALPTPAER
jgi:hypothetical protein